MGYFWSVLYIHVHVLEDGVGQHTVLLNPANLLKVQDESQIALIEMDLRAHFAIWPLTDDSQQFGH
jgi:hypothetical protein